MMMSSKNLLISRVFSKLLLCHANCTERRLVQWQRSLGAVEALKPMISRRSFRSSVWRPATSDWSSAQYLKFEAERTRPSRDLIAQIPLKSPKSIVDLGCGPGNSTAVLAAHFPNARVIGMDSSPDMIKKAKATLPNKDFTLADLDSYVPTEPADVLFSNAVFQWVPYAERIRIIKRLMQTQASGGIFAMQVPDNFNEPSHAGMRLAAVEGPWSKTLNKQKAALDPFQSPQELYDEIKPLCSTINLWHTDYEHILDNQEAVVEWVKGTGLRPFIDPLSEEERKGFLDAYLNRVKKAYPVQYDGKVLLRYPRLFMVAVRS